MQLFGKNLDREVAVVAEIGVNHEGDLDAALDLLRLAHGAGADAAKFQLYTPGRFASASDPGRLERVASFRLGEDDLRLLAGGADKLGLAIFSTPVSEDVVRFLGETFPAIKIASGDIDFEPVIRAAAETGKPVIVSTGLATMEEIQTAVEWFADAAGTGELRDRLILMHCVSAYPTPIEEANVLSVPFLAAETGLRVGYSNHVIGLEACFAAVALGACMIEVHFTDCKTGRDFRDHSLSCDPDDLALLVEAVPRIRAGLGAPGKTRQPSELPALKAVRKGVVAARDLDGGTVLKRGDLMFARPATEFAAQEIDPLPGRRLLRAVGKGELIRRDDVEGD